MAKSCVLKVYYTWGEQGGKKKYDPDFKRFISWDLPLLEDYTYEFLTNKSKEPGSHHFKGIINTDIIEKITLFNPSAILIYGWAYQSHLKVIRHFKGKIPIWFRGDSTLIDHQSKIKNVFRSIFLKWVYNNVDKAFYVGTANKNYYLKYGLKPDQLIFAPHAVDNDRFALGRQSEANALRKKLSINQEDILILFAGKFEPKKNPELLLEAFMEIELEVESWEHKKNIQVIEEKSQMLKVGSMDSDDNNAESKVETVNIDYLKENDQSSLSASILCNIQRTGTNKIHLLFVGNGILEDSLKSKVSLHKSPKVHFMPFQNQKEMPLIYQASDLFCLPSQGPGETWGLAVNEAMASSKAILISDKVGCSLDLVEKGINGDIFESGNLIELKDKLVKLTHKREDLQKMGKKSKEIISNWSIKLQSKTILKNLNY